MAALVALGAALILMLLAPRLRLPTAAAFALSAALLAACSTSGMSMGAQALAFATIAPSTLAFATAVFALFVLSAQLQISGALTGLAAATARSLPNPRARVAALPALIGLLPMPGGAVVSAPMVERCGLGDGDAQHCINYWFRHVWEICSPFYPPVILAAGMSGCALAEFGWLMTPLMVMLIAVGAWWFLRALPAAAPSQESAEGRGLDALIPIVLVIATAPLFAKLLASWGITGNEWALAAGCLPGLLFLTVRCGFHSLWRALTARRTWTLVLVAWLIKVFGTMVSASGSATVAADLLVAMGGAMAGALLVPFVAGLATGNMVAAVSITFPIVAALPENTALSGEQRLMVFGTAYAAGFVGYMLSPVHLCLVLSAAHFRRTLLSGWGRVVAPMLLSTVLGAAYFMVRRSFLTEG